MNDNSSRASQLQPLHTPSSPVSLPHHRLIAYAVAVELLAAVRAASLRDAKLRDEALRSAKSACLNTAEGAGRVTRADKARSFAIARAEAGEAAAAVEIASLTGDAAPGARDEVNRLASRLVALLTGLIRRGAPQGPRYLRSPRSRARNRPARARASRAVPASRTPMAAARSTAPATSWTEPSACRK